MSNNKTKDIEILENKILKISGLIDEYVKHNISQNKIDKLISEKERYENWLEKIKNEN